MDHDQAAYDAAIIKREADWQKCRQAGVGYQAGNGLAGQAGAGLAGNCMAAREMTVGEWLDQEIRNAVLHRDALVDLRDSLPRQFLNSGFSRVAPLVKSR